MKTYRLMLEVNLEDDNSGATVGIGFDTDKPPFAALMVATEHLMTLTAMNHEDFEQSLKLLCDGARNNKVKMFEGKRADQ